MTWLGADDRAAEVCSSSRVTRYLRSVADGSTIRRKPAAPYARGARARLRSQARTGTRSPPRWRPPACSTRSRRRDDRGRRARQARSGRLRLALERSRDLRASGGFEDTEAGVAAAKARGCAAWRTREACPEGLAADELAPALLELGGARRHASSGARGRSRAARTPPRSARAPRRCPCGPAP